jgi:thioredoxin
MEILNVESFKEKVFNFEASKDWAFKGQKPVIIDFYADWCAPCKALASVLSEISSRYSTQLNVYKVNTETTPELAALFGVRGIPAILFVPLKGEPSMSTGFMPVESFENAIDDIFGIQTVIKK